MHRYQYEYGDRPLEGYTIQRAAGYGGFGEVYYAVSDSGRQVALKTVQNYEQIELRGIKQCMNLKSPHLVTIFDVRYNDQGRPFVLMEYVAGVSLRDILDDAPAGIGTQKAAFFLREIAKGLSHLHDCGIVHRDLKPSNIFYENGYVKIGDYGLTKAINQDQHSAQTVTVGTVQYMAPEVGEGRYDLSIDIYALGILLYEMLTGQVPFFGASPGEVLMKHLSAEPDLTGIEEPFARAIRRALAKDPGERYPSVQALVEDVFGTEHVRQSVSQFSPESLSVVAARVAREARISPPPASAERSARPETGGCKPAAAGRPVAADDMTAQQRQTLATITVALLALGLGVLAGGSRPGGAWALALSSAAAIGGGSFGLLFAQNRLLRGLDNPFLRHWIAVGIAALCVVPLAGVFSPDSMSRDLFLPLAALGLVNWWSLTLPDRRERISWSPVVRGGILAFVFGLFLGGQPVLSGGVVAGILLVIQIVSPWCRVTLRRRARPMPPETARPRDRVTGPAADAVPDPSAPAPEPAPTPMHSARPSGYRPVPPEWRTGFFVLSLLSFAAGLYALISAGLGRHSEDAFAARISFGVGGILTALWCLPRVCRGVMVSWYRFLVKPALLLGCVLTTVTSSVFLGNVRMYGDQQVFFTFLIIFPAVLFLFILFLPSRLVEGFAAGRPLGDTAYLPVSPHARLWALLLALPFPLAGLQRFYVGKIGTGFLWLFTGGLFGVGQLIDLVRIVAGMFTDARGRPVQVWLGRDAWAAPAVSPVTPEARPGETPAEDAVPAPSAEPAGPLQPATTADRLPSSSGVSRLSGPVIRFHPLGTLASVLGYALIVLAAALAVVVALHLPHLLALVGPDPVVSEIQGFFGFAEWPRLVERVVFGLVLACLALAAVLVVMGRRHGGSTHVLRGMGGLVLLGGSLFPCCEILSYQTFTDPGVRALWQSGQAGQALDLILNQVDADAAFWAALVFVSALVCLAWPPRRTATASVPLDSGVN